MKNINPAQHGFYSEKASAINDTPMERSQTTHESLQSEKAQQILPYLTLDKLDKREVSGLLDLSNDVIDAMDQGKLPRDKFSTAMALDDAIAVASGEEAIWAKGEVSPKLAQARKLVCACLLNETDSKNPERKWEIYNSFFGSSPDIASHCGGLRGSLELLTIAERVSQNPCASEIYDEIVYDNSFKGQNDFKAIIHDSNPIQQLRLIPIYNGVALHCDADGFSKTVLDKVIQALDTIENDNQTKPLVRLTASLANTNIIQWFDDEQWVDIDDENPEHQMMLLEHRQQQLAWVEAQRKIHKTYPALPENSRLNKIAPDVGGALDESGNVVQISNQKGEVLSLLNSSRDNVFGLDRDTAFLISAAHNPGVEKTISDKIGLKLSDIPFDPQVQLLKFMTEAGSDRFDKLCSTLTNTDKPLRFKLTENFVAADFGEDFGDSLLEIASSEHLTDREKAQILDNMSSCRESIGVIAGWYKGLDKGVFTRQYTRAANERLTDIITVFREIAKKGAITADSGRGERITFDYESAIEALKYETKSLEIISGTVQDVADGENGAFAEIVMLPDKSHSSKNRTVYNLYSPSHGHVLLHTRPEGAHSFDPQLEYGKVGSRYNSNSVNTGTEASISFMANPVEPFSLPTPFKNLPWYKQDNLRPRGEKSDIKEAADNYKRNRVSAIRLDREGIPLGAPANDPNRDPVAPQGRVSVDLSSIGDKPNTPSGKIARLITVGNMVRAKERDSNEIYLNHNTKWFDEKYGTTDGFKRLVNHIDTLMCGDGRTYPGLVGLRPPAKGEGLIEKWRELERQLESGDQEHVQAETDILLGGQIETATKRQKNQRRGKKAMKTTGTLEKMSRPVPSLDTPNPSNTPDTSGPDVA